MRPNTILSPKPLTSHKLFSLSTEPFLHSPNHHRPLQTSLFDSPISLQINPLTRFSSYFQSISLEPSSTHSLPLSFVFTHSPLFYSSSHLPTSAELTQSFLLIDWCLNPPNNSNRWLKPGTIETVRFYFSKSQFHLFRVWISFF